MKIAQINITTNGSTGKIMRGIAEVAEARGHITQTYSPIRFARGNQGAFPALKGHTYWGSRLESFWHYYAGSLLGRNGLFSRRGTKQLIKNLKAFAPDVVQLHNLHAYCLHLPTLFRYFKKEQIPVVWTLHDCWSFTGNCAHFTLVNCDRWKTGCHHCPQPKTYPKMFIDTSKKMYRLKQHLFTALDNLTLVTPSKWLGDLAKQSFFAKHPVCVIHNGIDLSVFTPTTSDVRDRYNLHGKKIVLGVASGWSTRKGLDVFLELAKRLPDDYRVVLVGAGVSGHDRVVGIPRTEDQQELVALYSAADVFVNPTREDTFPTVNIEALACGTPVVTFKTGGSPEIADDTCGSVVEVDDVETMRQEILRICEQSPYSADACMRRAAQFDRHDRFLEYVQLYEEMNGQ